MFAACTHMIGDDFNFIFNQHLNNATVLTVFRIY